MDRIVRIAIPQSDFFPGIKEIFPATGMDEEEDAELSTGVSSGP